MRDNWWAGLSFSPGMRQMQLERDELLQEIIDFHSRVKKPRDLEDEDTELFDRVSDFTEQWEDKIGDDDQEQFTKFILWYKQMKDPKSKFELLDEAIENIISVEEALVGNFGKTYNSEKQKFYPEQFGKKLPKSGAWIMVIAEYIGVQNPPERFSVYYAKSDAITREVTPYGSASMKVPYYKIKITTQHGDLSLWPHEYVIVEDITEVMNGVGNDFELIRLGGDTNYDSAKVHYLGTRGIPQKDVYDMLLTSVGSTNYCYFKLSNVEYQEYYTFFFDCMERGIRAEMVPRLWECKKTGKPLFKTKYTLHGKEVTEDEFNAYASKDRKEADTTEYTPEA